MSDFTDILSVVVVSIIGLGSGLWQYYTFKTRQREKSEKKETGEFDKLNERLQTMEEELSDLKLEFLVFKTKVETLLEVLDRRLPQLARSPPKWLQDLWLSGAYMTDEQLETLQKGLRETVEDLEKSKEKPEQDKIALTLVYDVWYGRVKGELNARKLKRKLEEEKLSDAH